jgi:hypothetical protein
MRSKHRYTVRKTVSGYSGEARYYVFDLLAKQRVTVHSVLRRDAAQMEADSLNVAEMTRPYAEDPRPYELRRREAEIAYQEIKLGDPR